jgi:formylglycine-generating enzyme required for sulfatase activity
MDYWYVEKLDLATSQRNPRGPSTGDARVVQGSDWGVPGDMNPLGHRGSLKPSSKGNTLGFRVARNYTP